jgi:SAM-dependent methyltransferase
MDNEREASSVAGGVTPQGQKVAAHWSRLSLSLDGALEALKSKGIPPERATAEDLHGLDMLHMGGLRATDELAEMAGIRPGHEVLDVGSGVGGPARRLARKFDARVWGVELGESIHQTAIALTSLVGLQEKVRFKRGSALALPFKDGMFDVVIMQHIAMQVAEKDRLFAESLRVLKPGGTLALHEIFSGPGGPPIFPLAWASDPEMSALESFEACASRLEQRGLAVGDFVDHSEAGRQYHAANIAAFSKALDEQRGAEGRSLQATEARLKTATSMERNLREGRLRVGMVVCRKGAEGQAVGQSGR